MQSRFVLCIGSSAFPIVDSTWPVIVFRFPCQPPCSGKFAWLGSHRSLATRKGATVEVVKVRCQKTLQQMQLHKNHNSGTVTVLCKNHNFGTASGF